MRFLLGSGSWGAVIPHAPLLIPGVNPSLDHHDLIAALEIVRERRKADVVVLVSSHGERTGVYSRLSGSLDAMSIPGRRVDVETDHDLVRELVLHWGEPRLETPVDHGAVVPLLLDALPTGVPIVGCALQETTGPGKSFSGPHGRAAASLAAAIAAFAGRRRIAVIASAHIAAALAPHAPLTLRPGAGAFVERVFHALGSDVAGLLEIDEAAWQAADPCGRAPLLVLAHLFQGHPGTVHAYDDSIGVGYMVATIAGP